MYSFLILVDCFDHPCGLCTLLLEIQNPQYFKGKKRGVCYSISPLTVSPSLKCLLRVTLSFKLLQGHLQNSAPWQKTSRSNQELPNCTFSQLPPQPEPDQELLAELHFLHFHSCEKAMTTKEVMSTCANGTGMCTSPSAPHPGGQPGTAAKQKACFLGRSELAPPTSPLSSILLPGW